MGRYTQLYDPATVKGPGDARPTTHQIMADNNRLPPSDTSLAGKFALVTGCTSGLGPDIAKALLEGGMQVWAAGRGLQRLRDAMSGVGVDPSSTPNLHFLEIDLSEMDAVRRAAAVFLEESGGRLNILINNAGVMACPPGMKTKDGLDMQFGTNHIGHFLLFSLVKDALVASATPDFHSRVVNTSSSGHRMGSVRFDDLNFSKRPEEYGNGYPAYGQSKTANIWMANHIERLYGSKRVHGWSLMPGGILTPLQRHLAQTNPDMIETLLQSEDARRWMRSPEQGAATVVWPAVARELEGQGGKYCENCEIIGPSPDMGNMMDYGYAPWAYDEEGERKLWKVSCEITSVAED